MINVNRRVCYYFQFGIVGLRPNPRQTMLSVLYAGEAAH